MTLDEIINEKHWWYLPDKKYVMDTNWVRDYQEPAPYEAFKWWDQYTYRTPRYYFRVVIREHTDKRMETAKSELYSKKFSVIVKGAISEVPLPIEIWEEQGTPWKSGTSYYIDVFYFGNKYKKYDEEYTNNAIETPAALVKGFDTVEEARDFADWWMNKALEDHKEELKIEKEIMKLTQ